VTLEGSIALYAGVLYVATRSAGGPVLAIDTNSRAVQSIGRAGASANDVAVDASGVYWTESGALQSAPLGGGSATSLLSGIRPQRLALDATHVYFTTGASDPTIPNQIQRIPKAGGTAEVIATGVLTAAITVTSNGVYFTDRNYTTSEGIISVVPSAGGPSVVLAKEQGFPTFMASDSRRVFWLDQWPSDVKAMDQTSGAITTLYAAPAARGRPNGVWLDETNLYFTDSDTGNVMKVQKEGGPVATVAKGSIGVSGIVGDAEYLYWVIEAPTECGRVLRIHK
jgi:sugar lactone lactonase YvrE